MTDHELSELALKKLEMRFNNKIDKDKYYITYSGGNDSELLRWFIKDCLNLNIPVIAVNTQREHNEIRRRMYNNSDEVLLPLKSMEEIKNTYGMPCFTKFQDEIIHRYQKGSRARYTLDIVNGTGCGTGRFRLNNKARELLLSGQLHKVSQECCKYTKKKPLQLFEKETGLIPIIAVRGSESANRKARYKTCLDKKGKFTPMYDISEDMIRAITSEYNLKKPKVYDVLDRTGCIGCPYGRHIKDELELATDSQKEYAINSFKESYIIKGIIA